MNLPLDTEMLLRFALLWLAIVPTPGANSLMVTHLAMTRPAIDVTRAIAGNVAGVALLASCALLGLAAAISALPWLRLVVQFLGGSYLVYFGWRLIARSIRIPTAEHTPPAGITITQPGHRTFALGFFTALSNTQAIVFITSIYAATGILNANLATGLASIAIIIAFNGTYLAMLGWLFQRQHVRDFYSRFRWVFELTIGILFVVLGGRLLLNELAVWRS
jgi:threonine efflux protein